MAMPSDGWKYLERDPHSSYKQLSIKGRGIRARTLFGQTVGEDARSAEELAADFDLPMEAVLEAVAYCESNPPEILQDFLYEEAIAEATGMNHPMYKYDPKQYYRPLSPAQRARIRREFS